MHIRDVLARKPSAEVVTVAPSTTVRDLLALLAERNIGACVVCEPDPAPGSTGISGSGGIGGIAGIVSERDVVRHLHADGPAVLDRTVAALMTTDVTVCSPDDALEDLLGVMTQRRVRHLPVLSDGRLAGIVSIGDLVKHRIDQLTFERDQLDSYVHGS
jgi:CBS domain-containing protein